MLLFRVIDVISCSDILQVLPGLWITNHKCSLITMMCTVLQIFWMLWFCLGLNCDIGSILKIDPSLHTELTLFPSHIIIDLWIITHRNANSNGLSFNCIALYDVVLSISTTDPTVAELMGAWYCLVLVL